MAHGLVCRDNLVPFQILRLVLMNKQMDQIADAILSLYGQREKIHSLQESCAKTWGIPLEYCWVLPHLDPLECATLPHEIHTIG